MWLAEGLQGCRVELPQGGAQLVELALTVQIRLRWARASTLTASATSLSPATGGVVGVGACQFGQQLGAVDTWSMPPVNRTASPRPPCHPRRPRRRRASGQPVGGRSAPGGEAGVFEHAHRAVPQDGARRLDEPGERRRGLHPGDTASAPAQSGRGAPKKRPPGPTAARSNWRAPSGRGSDTDEPVWRGLPDRSPSGGVEQLPGVVGGEGSCPQEALPDVAPAGGEKRGLARVFYAFGHGAQPERPGHVEDGEHQFVGFSVALVHRGDERLVDFEDVDREVLQVGQRGVAGAEVVDGDTNPRALSARRTSATSAGSCTSMVSVTSSTTRSGAIPAAAMASRTSSVRRGSRIWRADTLMVMVRALPSPRARLHWASWRVASPSAQRPSGTMKPVSPFGVGAHRHTPHSLLVCL
jgi:hypothetical protein